MIVKIPNIKVVPMLKNVDETMAGTIIKIENGFEIPPVKYNKAVNWTKSYIKIILALKSFIRIDLTFNWRKRFVKSPIKIIERQNIIGNSNFK